jgi:hypothetical protein
MIEKEMYKVLAYERKEDLAALYEVKPSLPYILVGL